MELGWKTFAMPLCTLSVPLEDLAAAMGVPVQRWDEPGLGEANGFVLKHAAGTLMLEELAHAREHLGAKGPTVYVDASDLVGLGVDRFLASALEALRLTQTNVVWLQSQDALDEVRGRVAKIA